ncbi:Nuclear pore complex protein Nup93 [Manis javanica]|nr:Nuclear pore complex protein Nup93 [Manis javanica]
MMHLKASAPFRKVHTLQSQSLPSDDGFGCRFGLVGLFLSPMAWRWEVKEDRYESNKLTKARQLQGFLKNEKDNALLSAIEESRKRD